MESRVILTIRQQTWVLNTMCLVVVLLSSKLGSSRDTGKQTNKQKSSTDVFSYLHALGSVCILCYFKQVFKNVLWEIVEDLPTSLR